MIQDNVQPDNKWKFDQEVTDVFDNMLERSIPLYNTMRQLVCNIGTQVIKDFNLLSTKTIIDIGSSKGRALESVYRKNKDCNFIGIEISKPMYNYCLEEYKDIKNITFYNEDLREFYPKQSRPDNVLTLSILTLCFVPIEYRTYVLNNIYTSLSKGGAFIVVEKCLSNTYKIESYLNNVYYNMKKEHNYTNEQIKAKRKSLEGVLVPLTTKFNEDLFKSVGFSKIEMFWKYLNFTGWILIK